MIRRTNDFDLRLARFAQQEIGRPFEWGSTNCVMLSLRAIDCMCCTTLAEEYAHPMRSARAASCWVRRHGLPGMIDALRDVGLVEVRPGFEQPGDLRLTACDGTLCAHVYMGGSWLSSTAEDGVIVIHSDGLLPADIIMGVR